MTRPEPLDLLRQRLHASRNATPECLDDETLAALADGALDAAAREAVMPHLAACQRCRDVVAAVARTLADGAVASQVTALEGRARRGWLRIGLPAAAAAIFVALILPRWLGDADGGHRGTPLPTAQVPRPLGPIGTVASARALRWASPTGARADRYRVALFDSAGRVLYERQLTDTTTALPDSVALVPGRTYFWLVEGRIAVDRWAGSDLVRFSISPPSRP